MDDQSTGVRDFAQHTGLHLPLGGDGEEVIKFLRANNRHHALLTLRHQNLFCGEGVIAQEDMVESDLHAAVAVRREF